MDLTRHMEVQDLAFRLTYFNSRFLYRSHLRFDFQFSLKGQRFPSQITNVSVSILGLTNTSEQYLKDIQGSVTHIRTSHNHLFTPYYKTRRICHCCRYKITLLSWHRSHLLCFLHFDPLDTVSSRSSYAAEYAWLPNADCCPVSLWTRVSRLTELWAKGVSLTSSLVFGGSGTILGTQKQMIKYLLHEKANVWSCIHSCLAESGDLNNCEEFRQMEEDASQARKFAYELCRLLDELIRWFRNCFLSVPILSQMVLRAKLISFQQFSLKKKKKQPWNRVCSLQKNLYTPHSYDKDYLSPCDLDNQWRHSTVGTSL